LIDAEPGYELRTLLLVWIDEKPENIAHPVAQARKMGIYAIEMTSTAMAKAWVDAVYASSLFPLTLR